MARTLQPRRIPILGLITAFAYIGCVYLANWLILNVGAPGPGGVHTIPVWPGISAPSGVLAAGLALTMRDLTQDRLGRGVVIVCILVGTALSALLSPGLALASGAAFLVSEVADMAVYTPLKERSHALADLARETLRGETARSYERRAFVAWLLALLLSNTVGLLVDSALFLWLAFGSLAFIAGQVIGKAEMTIVAVVILALARYTAPDAAREG